MRGYDDVTLKRAKTLRRDLTPAERKLWSILRNVQLDGAKFRRQQPIGPFIADFVCHDRKLVIEADGGQHSESASDERRTALLNLRGYRVLRFWNNEIIGNIDGVATAILDALTPPHPAQASLESPFPSRGEGKNGASHG